MLRKLRNIRDEIWKLKKIHEHDHASNLNPSSQYVSRRGSRSFVQSCRTDTLPKKSQVRFGMLD